MSVSLPQPVGIASDAAGNLYFPSIAHHRVYKISTTGTLSIIAGTGLPGFSGDNGPAASAQLNQPYGVAVNSAGTVVYIADRNNNRVRMVSGGIISTVAGGGVPSPFYPYAPCVSGINSVGDGCPGTSAVLSSPVGLVLDSSGTLYIADSANGRIRKLSAGVMTTVAGGGCCTLGDNGLATDAELNLPSGIALDPSNGDLYAGDSSNFRVRRVSAATGIITTSRPRNLRPRHGL